MNKDKPKKEVKKLSKQAKKELDLKNHLKLVK
jgi:hypothetical protein